MAKSQAGGRGVAMQIVESFDLDGLAEYDRKEGWWDFVLSSILSPSGTSWHGQRLYPSVLNAKARVIKPDISQSRWTK
jgi:hypothetical protein